MRPIGDLPLNEIAKSFLIDLTILEWRYQGCYRTVNHNALS